ncbi:MAG: transcription elongation factor GreB [Steroidobacteraceae bacterium]
MSRYRPPTKPGSRFITAAGERCLRAELDQLWRHERPQVTAAVSAAAAQGDRSENADYTYGKRRLREIDARVRFLRKRLEGMVIVSDPPTDRSRIYFGAWVILENDAGDRRRLRIVGPDELAHDGEYVSMDAPLPRALMGKQVDEEVTVAVPEGERSYVIVAIGYEDRPSL